MPDTVTPFHDRSTRATIASLLGMTFLGACASTPTVPPGYLATLRTTAPADAMTACIAQSVAATPTSDGKSTVIDAANAQPPRRYTIAQNDGETIVTVQGDETAMKTTTDRAALDCLQRTSAPAAIQ